MKFAYIYSVHRFIVVAIWDRLVRIKCMRVDTNLYIHITYVCRMLKCANDACQIKLLIVRKCYLLLFFRLLIFLAWRKVDKQNIDYATDKESVRWRREAKTNIIIITSFNRNNNLPLNSRFGMSRAFYLDVCDHHKPIKVHRDCFVVHCLCLFSTHTLLFNY